MFLPHHVNDSNATVELGALCNRTPTRQLSPEQKEMSRQRSRIYYAQHKAKVLAKLKARYDVPNKAIRSMSYQSSPSLIRLETVSEALSLAFILN
ncbi:hypothetical protein SPRG_13764 [Saprolegnia parasitica CBS 223.65]|uniref:Uncharacterized protein n=1 Tax=Saprolegnia parasitica (strain CBS 223.65) TaxID=695850 RepID=A0A067C0N9_SAPPC|nr:hypothetical protein SPRG_13764 [Saprolegnia parasitica CBS 223.65]KDO20382.1 hypothetical protein SPRG_13764 [Saprolegnia parasitica CBS 223.65]|eukprot:XP_012208909.1 hypothetical protein SPRG_13764 [Saprolegnia parasitica CBS 223.65]